MNQAMMLDRGIVLYNFLEITGSDNVWSAICQCFLIFDIVASASTKVLCDLEKLMSNAIRSRNAMTCKSRSIPARPALMTAHTSSDTGDIQVSNEDLVRINESNNVVIVWKIVGVSIKPLVDIMPFVSGREVVIVEKFVVLHPHKSVIVVRDLRWFIRVIVACHQTNYRPLLQDSIQHNVKAPDFRTWMSRR